MTPEAVAAKGLRHTVTEATVFVPECYCLDYSAAGLALSEEFENSARVPRRGDESTGTVDFDSQDDDAKAAGEAVAAQAKLDAERRERRKVIALNKLGEAALYLRRDFVTKLLTGKPPPTGAAMFVADCLARDSALLSEYQAQDTAAALLGVDNGPAVARLVADLPATGDSRAQVIALALVLGALESRTPRTRGAATPAIAGAVTSAAGNICAGWPTTTTSSPPSRKS
ncbi:hypothetical protein [Mycobacterium sp.]|uniref:hypothetical protein n=1 Tax=Mycobacterium sp. TaxID=1785 RepID=UPI0031DE9206